MKVKEMQNNIAIYSHALLRIHVIGGQRSVRIAPPCLLIAVVQQPGTSSPPSQLKCSPTGVIWMCKASFTNYCPLPWSSTVAASSQWIRWWCYVKWLSRYNTHAEEYSWVSNLLMCNPAYLADGLVLILLTPQLGSTTFTLRPSHPQYQPTSCRYAMKQYHLQK